MPSAFRDANGWIASFRGYRSVGRNKRRVRVPKSQLNETNPKASATAYAAECERYCRLLEGELLPEIGTLAHAVEIGAVTQKQADGIREQQPLADRPNAPLTIDAAARMHPSSGREIETDPTSAIRHERELKAFMEWAAIRTVEEITLELVQRWVAELKRQGKSWDGRRHALLWLRRATRMASTRGMADVLGALQLDRRERVRGGVQAWTMDEIAKGLVALEKAGNQRAWCATALGAILGLRPSECIRLQVRDLVDDRLAVGASGAKTRESERTLPVPRFVAERLQRLAKGRDAASQLLVTFPDRKAKHRAPFDQGTFGKWLGPVLTTATGRSLPVKALRKSFSSWAFRAGLPAQHVEAFLGHRTALASVVTGRFYLAELVAQELAPTAERIDTIWREKLAKLQSGATKS